MQGPFGERSGLAVLALAAMTGTAGASALVLVRWTAVRSARALLVGSLAAACAVVVLFPAQSPLPPG